MSSYEGKKEYPKALRAPDFSAKPVLVKQNDGSYTEDQLDGRHAQVVVKDEEEEKAVLAKWAAEKNAPKATSTTTPAK